MNADVQMITRNRHCANSFASMSTSAISCNFHHYYGSHAADKDYRCLALNSREEPCTFSCSLPLFGLTHVFAISSLIDYFSSHPRPLQSDHMRIFPL